MAEKTLPALRDGSSAAIGPAMAKLSPKRQLFVHALFELGTDNTTEAARQAGYIDNKTGAIKVTASRLAANPDIKAAIQEVARQRMTVMGLPVALKHLFATIDNPQHKQQVKAIEMVMNRAGLHELVERQVNVNVTLSRAEKETEIRQMAEKLGMDAEKLLGTVTDAEFETVPDGLEDIW